MQDNSRKKEEGELDPLRNKRILEKKYWNYYLRLTFCNLQSFFGGESELLTSKDNWKLFK